MHILFYTTYGHTTPVFEAELELIYYHLKAGDRVSLVKCGAVLQGCMFNPTRDLLRCGICQGRIWKGLETIGYAQPEMYDILDLYPRGSVAIPNFQNVQELKKFEWEGIDVGMSVASSIISQLRDHRFDTQKYRNRIVMNAEVAINSALNARKYYAALKPDRVYIFNGRFADQRPWLRVGQQMGIDVYCHERGCNLKKWNVTPNTLPHDGVYIQQKMWESWTNAPENRDEIAAGWFIDRSKGVIQNNKAFVAGQDRSLLPKGFDPNKMNIGIFNSSQDEYEAIFATYNLKLFEDQSDAIRSVCAHFVNNPNIHFYLRVHPNLKGVDCTQNREIAALNFPNLTVIPPESPVGSYKLLEACDKALVMGSAMGPEATFWNKPSILIGSSAYNTLDCTYNPETREELYKLLETKDLQPKDKQKALIYGYYNNTFGYAHTLFSPINLNEGTFMGKKLWVDKLFFTNAYAGLRKRLKTMGLIPVLNIVGFESIGKKLIQKQIDSLKAPKKI